MVKVGRNSPCLCGSGKKYKNCCLNKKPREQTVIVGSPEPLHGFYFDKEKLEITGLTLNNQLMKPAIVYSQTLYKGESGKKRVVARIQDKVIPNQEELMRYLSSHFDIIIAIDTNTKVIGNKRLSVTGIVHCVLKPMSEPGKYHVDFPWHALILFRNGSRDLPSEKYGWMTEIQRINREPLNKGKRFGIVTDHDLDNHASYNKKLTPIIKDFFLPENFRLIYGRADGSNQNLLNYLVKLCDKESTNVLTKIEQTGYYQHGDKKISIEQIPIPG